MRGLKKNHIKRGQTKIQRYKHTCQLIDQLGPEGRVGEKLYNLLVTVWALPMVKIYSKSLGYSGRNGNVRDGGT